MKTIPKLNKYEKLKNLGNLDGESLAQIVIAFQHLVDLHPDKKLTLESECDYYGNTMYVAAEGLESDEEYEKRVKQIKETKAATRRVRALNKKQRETHEKALFEKLKAKYEPNT